MSEASGLPHMRAQRAVQDEAVLTFSKDRLGAVCDGVAAITATLLVIDLKVPFGDEGSLLWSDLAEQAHLLLAWAISFLMVGVIWYEQHFVFAHSARLDTAFIVAALCQLAFLSLIPFASSMIGLHLDSLVAALVFTAVMTINGFVVALQSFILARRAHLHASPTARRLAERATMQLVAYSLIALFSVAVAIVHMPLTGIVAWLMSPLIPAGLQLHSRRKQLAPPHAAQSPARG